MTVIGEILTGMNILEKLGRLWNWLRGRKNKPAETIAVRFVRLFESHGVHRNQIPRFIGHGLTLSDVQDEAALLAKLDEPLLEAVCEKFAVRREWLDGAEKQIHPVHDFYKHPDGFATFLDDLSAANPEGDLQGILLQPEECNGQVEALLILQETVGLVGDKPIYRFHLCNNWSFTYWKSRAYLTACVAIAWRRGVYISGTTVAGKKINSLANGETLLGWQGEGAWFIGGRKWYPEDMALKPEVFLAGVDAENNNFGIQSALALWLNLAQQGLMEIGSGKDFSEKAISLFQQKLAAFQEPV